MKSKALGVSMLIVMGAILVISLTAGYVSQIYFGPDNPVEQGAEQVADDVIEEALNLPDGSVKLDLSPEK